MHAIGMFFLVVGLSYITYVLTIRKGALCKIRGKGSQGTVYTPMLLRVFQLHTHGCYITQITIFP